MQARHAARELALLALFTANPKHPLPESADSFNEVLLNAVRTLTLEAEQTLSAATHIWQDAMQCMIDTEIDHPDNLNSALSAARKPVALPNTRQMAEQIEACLHAVELVQDFIRVPELSAMANQVEVSTYAHKLVITVTDKLTALDEVLNAHMDDWRMDRLSKMDATLLRLAAAEMLYMPQVDLGVSIDEAVLMSKQYSEEDSYKLINGVLGSLAREMQFNPESGLPSVGLNANSTDSLMATPLSDEAEEVAENMADSDASTLLPTTETV